jgi:hypothetical protein
MEIGITTNAVILVLSTIFIGVATPIKTYIGVTANPNFGNPMWKSSEKNSNRQINLKEPIGVFGIQHDVNKNVRLFLEHQSSIPEKDDGLGFNHLGVKLLFPVEKNTNLYTGISLHSPEMDNDRTKMNNPIVILGGEYGGRDVKTFAEYISSADDFNNGRFYTGIKYIFN